MNHGLTLVQDMNFLLESLLVASGNMCQNFGVELKVTKQILHLHANKCNRTR